MAQPLAAQGRAAAAWPRVLQGRGRPWSGAIRLASLACFTYDCVLTAARMLQTCCLDAVDVLEGGAEAARRVVAYFVGSRTRDL